MYENCKIVLFISLSLIFQKILNYQNCKVILLQVPLEVAWTATVSWEAGDLVCRVMVFLRSVQILQIPILCISGTQGEPKNNQVQRPAW